MTTDEQVAESSPAPTIEPIAPAAPPSLDRLTTEQRATWRKTGALPDAKLADSSPATPEKAASTEVLPAPASEPGTPKPKKNAESRIQELLAERAHLRQELEAAKRPVGPPQVPDVPAVSSPAPVGEKFPDFDTWSAQQPESQSSYEDYIDARAVHVFQQQQQVREQRDAQAAAEKESQTRLREYRKQADQFVTDHADYWQVIDPITKASLPQSVLEAIDGALARAGYSPQLLYHLGQHLDEFEALIALPPAQAAYELGQLSARLSAPATPVVKTLSTAPEPPPTLRSKPATPVDDVEAAVKRGDFASYRLAMNRKTIGSR